MDAFMIKNLLITNLLEEEPELFLTYNGLSADIYIDNIMDISISDGLITCLLSQEEKEFTINDNNDIQNFARNIFPQLI